MVDVDIRDYELVITLRQGRDWADSFADVVELYKKDPQKFDRAREIRIVWG